MENNPESIIVGTPQFKRKELVFRLIFDNLESSAGTTRSMDSWFLTKIAYMTDQEVFEFYSSHFKKAKK